MSAALPMLPPEPVPDPAAGSPPLPDDVDPWAHAVMLRREALAAGLDDRSIRRAVHEGTLRRIKYGAYSPAEVYDVLDEARRHGLRSRAVLRSAKTELVLSHTSALVEHGAPDWGLDLEDVHVIRTDQRAGRVEAGVHQHQSRLRPGDRIVRNGVPCTSPTRSVLDAATLLKQEAALCQLNHLLHVGLTTSALLEETYAGMVRHPGTLGIGLLLRQADGRVESLGESRTQFLMWRGGVPSPVPQYVVTDGRGHVVARLDFAWPELRAWLEFDGLVKYREPFGAGDDVAAVVLRERRREDLVRELTGWRVIRLTWADLERPVATVRRILAFLAAA